MLLTVTALGEWGGVRFVEGQVSLGFGRILLASMPDTWEQLLQD